jgi:glycosyltransferase involved in cell wall biosynthesis
VSICFTSHRYAPLVGGYENQIKLLAESLSKHFKVKVVTFNLTNSPVSETVNNVEVHRVTPQLIFFRVPFSLRYLEKLGKMDFDLLHAHGFVPVVSDLSVFYAKSKGKAAVYTHHFDGNVQDAKAWNILANVYNGTVARFGFEFADAIVTTTKSYAETSQALKPYLKRVTVIPCFVDCNRFQQQQPEEVMRLKRRLGLGDRKTVLFVGRIVPYKGLEYLIRAVDYAKREYGEELNLLMVGGEEGKGITDKSEYYQNIVDLAKRSVASDNIRFVGRVEDKLLPLYYSLADVVALPSTMRGEAFGTVLLEALACGTPIVASNIPGVQDVMKSNTSVGAYASPKDPVALSEALIKTAHGKEDVSYRCREFVLKNYEVAKVVQDYMRLYSELGLGPD